MFNFHKPLITPNGTRPQTNDSHFEVGLNGHTVTRPTGKIANQLFQGYLSLVSISKTTAEEVRAWAKGGREVKALAVSAKHFVYALYMLQTE